LHPFRGVYHYLAAMSRFWAAASSSEDEKGSDDDSVNEVQPAQRQAEKRFAGAFDESDSGKYIVSLPFVLSFTWLADRVQSLRMRSAL
jgi:hypothetical protein